MNSEAKDMLTGKISAEQWLKNADLYRDDVLKGITMYDGEDLGTCEETLTRLETALLMGLIYREVTGADIGLVSVDKSEQGTNCRLFAGTLSSKAVGNIAPDRTSAEGEVILEGKFADHFAVWFANHDNTIKRPEQTTILNWKTEE